MAVIQITPGDLRGEAQRLENFNTNIGETYREMENLVNNLVNEWKGEAQSAFKESFLGYRPQFDRFKQDIDNFAQLMINAANTLEQTDNELRGRMNV